MTLWNDFLIESARKNLRELIRENVVEVTFEKADGTDRTMLCTLMDYKIPEDMKSKNAGKKINPEVLPVFDLEKGEWRSFRYSSIKYFTIIT
jgi:hypothetical protein